MNGWLTPMEDVDTKPPVRCGRCGNNGTGLRNPECTARVHERDVDVEFSEMVASE